MKADIFDKSDVVNLAQTFNGLAGLISPVLLEPKTTSVMLFSFVKVFARGKGYRVGNLANLNKYWLELVTLAMALLNEIMSHPELYEHLARAGLSHEHEDDFAEALRTAMVVDNE